MKKIFITTIALIALFSCATTKKKSIKDMMAIMQVDEPILGVCDNSRVVVVLPVPGNGQVKAQAPLTDDEIIKKLNAEVDFLKGNKGYKDEGMVNIIINCKGEMVRCQISNKTKSPKLDNQIVAVFAKMVNWKAGTVNGNPVDTSELYSFKIENGVISF